MRTYHVAERAKKDFAVKIISSNSSHVPATPGSILSRLMYLWTSFWQAFNTPFDLIEGSNFVTYWPAFLAAKIKGKPVVAWIPDVLGRRWFDFGFLVGLFGWLAEIIALKLPWDALIALSNSTKTKLTNHGVPASKITVVYAGVDPQEFQFKKPQKFSAPTVICIARLVGTKRVVDLIEAFNQLLKSVPRAKLIIVGRGPKKKQLLELVNQLELTGSVSFYENLSRQELLQLLSRCQLLCLPSVVEGFGLVTIEAMSLGIPVVLADIPINREVTQSGKGAVFFKPADAGDMAEKIKQLLTDKKLYRQKEGETKNVAGIYRWPDIYRQTKQVYLQALK